MTSLKPGTRSNPGATAFLLAVLLCTVPAGRGGTVYKWRDDNGKWHFSDKAPPDRDAEQTDPGRINITEGSRATSELNTAFPRETPEEAAYRERKAAEARHRQDLTESWCNQARQRLETIRGRVIFLDSDGNPVEVTEEEREARAVTLAGRIRENCP